MNGDAEAERAFDWMGIEYVYLNRLLSENSMQVRVLARLGVNARDANDEAVFM